MASQQFRYSSISAQLIFYLVMVSSFLSLLLTAFQIYIDYDTQVKSLDNNLAHIEKIFQEPLAGSIWSYDEIQLKRQLEGILNFDQVAKIELSGPGLSTYLFHNNLTPNGPTKSFQIYYHDRIQLHELGVINITFTLEKIYNSILNKVLLILLSNLVKTFLVSIFLVFIYYRLVTKPLTAISQKSRQVRFEQSTLLHTTLSEEEQMNFDNELEEVSFSINMMEKNFQESYRNLQKTESMFRDLVTYGFDYVFECDSSYKISFVQSSGSSTDTLKGILLKGKSLLELPLNNETKKMLQQQKKLKDTVFIVNENNQIYYYSLSLKPIFNQTNKQYEGYRGFIVNITDKVTSQERVKQQEEQILQIQKTETIGELAAVIAHDFNNLLSIIAGNASILELIGEKNNVQLKEVQIIKDATQRGQKLTGRLLGFSRKQKIEAKPINTKSFLQNLQELIQIAVSRRINFRMQLDQNVGNIFTDPVQLENAIINICINARDAISGEGEIMLISHNESINNQNFIKISIQDNGSGMPEEIRKHIFDPYFTTKEPGKGTGLGLSMVSRFITDSKGTIEVKSEVNRGTEFILRFPEYKDSVSEVT